MRTHLQIAGLVAASMLLQPVRAQIAGAQPPFTSIEAPQGAEILQGKVEGAASQGAAMTALLRRVHEECGEKPQIGHVFKLRGTMVAGLFFATMNCRAGNAPRVGLILSVTGGLAESGSREQEAALVADSVDRIGETIDPMLIKLFGAWHPAGADPAVPLRTVKLTDESATVGVPEGWKLDPNSNGGTAFVTGPHQEWINLDFTYRALDTANKHVFKVQMDQEKESLKGKGILRPWDADLVKAFPEIVQQIRELYGMGPAKLTIEHGEISPAPAGEECARILATVDPDGKGDRELEGLICRSREDMFGGYLLQTLQYSLPKAVAEQERATAQAIVASFQSNMPLQDAEREVGILPQIPETQPGDIMRLESRIRMLKEDAKMRADASWFSNLLLDRAVIRELETGAKPVKDAHALAAAWTKAAELWEKAYPYRITEAPAEEDLAGQKF